MELKSWQKALVVGSNISTSLAILVGGGYFLGRYLDTQWMTKPLFTISCMLIGLALGGSYLVITLKEFGASDDKK
ncbi:AtpZ/AtpI family protein [Desulfosporosinus meridiei]|uniref:Putative F0F1-ATPase subunit (ATPase_gene1) n=1 Tax=Desulfosporosinus meridiei (strain ATCC BAA-275 / DSM 13257 / KCTC 12902 / NCIMB 13706 / S10) TaxID=768704 RepID=J7J531_DESMD|nr:AtpZ/AtpI family protein [Desulfosporosinus meridiei]AFQ46368.1 Putative F0F1-ATPase subunit (ATPase_gene1) [Desulfosporosinus meridiei DSM 13257]